MPARKRANTTPQPAARPRAKAQPAKRPSLVRTEPAPGALLLAPNEAAYLLRIGIKQMYALVGSGEIPSLKIGRSRRIARRALETYIETRQAIGA